MHPATETWAAWWQQLDTVLARLRRIKGKMVSASRYREVARDAVQYYFRQVRPQLVPLGIDAVKIDELDLITQNILELTSRTNRKASYLRRLRELSDLRNVIGTAIEIRAAGGTAFTLTTATESAILSTLDKILPTAALSYRQVLQDLGETNRSSYRGTAAELREVVRELLDHLAPDDQILKTIKLEKDQKRPSMKQKAVFILRARGIGETQRKTAEDAVTAVEESVGSLARSVYNRGSLSTHLTTTRREVRSFKGYADALLADLLQIHQ
jgi:hypothetical protein